MNPDHSSRSLSQSSRLSFLRRRGFWRALVAGLTAFVLGFLFFGVLLHFLRPFVWFAVTNDPYPPSTAPLDINSTEWLVIQFGRSSAWFFAGAVASRWSPPGSLRAVFVLCGTLLLLAIVVPRPEFNSILRLALWALAAPIAVLAGAGAATYLEQRSAPPNGSVPSVEHDA